ncbi:MAG: YihY/virulence factor BrkB family protein [Gemmatimonas sp.]
MAFSQARPHRRQHDNPGGDDARGRDATTPSDIPKLGWRDILLRVKDAVSEKSLGLIAAGAAFYAFIAIPSGIAALISIYGLMFNPASVERQIESFQSVMPQQAADIILDELSFLTSQPPQNLGIGLLVSLALALWSANSATTSIMTALNVAYSEREKRGLIKYYAEALLITLASVLFVIISLTLIAVLPAVINFLPLGDIGRTLASLSRWPVLVALFVFALSLAYRYMPSRSKPKWRWVTWGAVAGGLLWIAASYGFSFYVSHFSSYDKTYGSLAGVVLLLMWLYVSNYAVLLGAQLDAEIEHQTARDSTTGHPKPLGRRGAKMADTVGEEK